MQNQIVLVGDRLSVAFFLTLVTALMPIGSLAIAQVAPPGRAETLQLLGRRRQQQLQTSREFKAFRDFQFADHWQDSGITFEHHVVDDAGKYWKPAHYDHGNGIAVADVDGDGRHDLYFVTQLGICELWRNLGDGKFESITSRAGVGLTDQICVGAFFADIDNDNDPDLFVTTVRHGNHLFENLGGGRFKDITKEASLDYSGHSTGAVFFDFDNDGLLDLFLCNVGVYTIDEKGPGGYFLSITNAFHGHLYPERTEYKILYRNLGGKKFKNVTDETGLRDGSWAGDATFCDLNGDRFPDLYLVNMQGDDHFYENAGGRKFVEKTASYFPKTPWGAMGAKFFDYNNDGLMDLFVTDMHSDMTPAQTLQGYKLPLALEKQKSEQFCTARWDDAFLQGASNNIFGNAFYENKGGGRFVERSETLGVETYWPWGPSVGDLNADGFEDIFVTAGMGYPFRYAINSVLLNEAGQRFFDSEFLLGVEPRAGGRIEKVYFTLHCANEDESHPLCQGLSGSNPVDGSLSTRSAATFDLDDDGDLDIVTSEFNDHPQVLVSNLTGKKQINFLKVKLVGAVSNRDGLGATVTLQAGGRTLTRYHDGKSGYLSQSSLPLYFGLGNAERVERVEVIWPSGSRQELVRDIPTNSLVTIREVRR
jgi:enediyne biosynthesis protein E4